MSEDKYRLTERADELEAKLNRLGHSIAAICCSIECFRALTGTLQEVSKGHIQDGGKGDLRHPPSLRHEEEKDSGGPGAREEGQGAEANQAG